jgi:hypothetical protein
LKQTTTSEISPTNVLVGVPLKEFVSTDASSGLVPKRGICCRVLDFCQGEISDCADEIDLNANSGAGESELVSAEQMEGESFL